MTLGSISSSNIIKFSGITNGDILFSQNIELLVGFAYYCLGVLYKITSNKEAINLFRKSYSHFKNIQHSEFQAYVK